MLCCSHRHGGAFQNVAGREANVRVGIWREPRPSSRAPQRPYHLLCWHQRSDQGLDHVSTCCGQSHTHVLPTDIISIFKIVNQAVTLSPYPDSVNGFTVYIVPHNPSWMGDGYFRCTCRQTNWCLHIIKRVYSTMVLFIYFLKHKFCSNLHFLYVGFKYNVL